MLPLSFVALLHVLVSWSFVRLIFWIIPFRILSEKDYRVSREFEDKNMWVEGRHQGHKLNDTKADPCILALCDGTSHVQKLDHWASRDITIP